MFDGADESYKWRDAKTRSEWTIVTWADSPHLTLKGDSIVLSLPGLYPGNEDHTRSCSAGSLASESGGQADLPGMEQGRVTGPWSVAPMLQPQLWSL